MLITAYTNTINKENMKINLNDLHNIFLSGFVMLNYEHTNIHKHYCSNKTYVMKKL